MDSVWLTGPLGTQWNIGSWLDKTAQIDYGAAGLIRQQLSQNAFVEGARLAYETGAGPRTMTLPLIVPSGGVYDITIDALEASLRQMLRPGGHVDLQPAGVATAEMVRFDVLGGDLSHRSYDVDLQRINRRRFTLTLQTQPFGYWPTWITLASVASVSMNGGGALAIPAASVLGDVPGLAEFTFRATAGPQTASGALLLDGLAWGLGARPSFLAGLGAGSWAGGNYGPTYSTDGRGVGATQATLLVPPASPWLVAFTYQIPSTLEPAYRGRFHAYAQLFDAGTPHQVLLDAVPGVLPAGTNDQSLAMASANTLATTPGVYTASAPFYAIVDMGEVTLPFVASGAPQMTILRLWQRASSGATVALGFNGLWLQPLDGGAGIFARGLAAPTTGYSPSSLQALSGYLRSDTGGPLAIQGSAPAADLTRYYRGLMAPVVGATVQQLDMLGIQRYASIGSIGLDTFVQTKAYAAVSVRYQPRFQFTKGV